MAAPARAADLDEPALDRLGAWLAAETGATSVRLHDAQRLAGGAVQQNWRIAAEVDGGALSGSHVWVLRRDAAARLSMSLNRAQEYACIRAAHAAGVRVAPPIAVASGDVPPGAPFAVQAFIAGTAQGRRIVRDPQIERFGDELAHELGRQAALIHTIRPPLEELAFLPVPKLDPARAAVAGLRAAVDGASEPRPALEYILAWLEKHAPEPRPVALVHGDFRTGNYLVDQNKLTAILDWEFCHWGDPREDLGWFSARCWRFGADEREAGGIASLEALLAGYNSVASMPIGAAEIGYWQVLAGARWAAIALLQGDRFLKGGEQSLELALTGLMVPEMELDALLDMARLEAGGGRT